MPESKRVLSGSVTKGSRVTQQTELIPFQQGINVNTIGVVGDRLNPQLRSGDTLGIFKDGKRMRSSFDDTITLNNTLNDLREDDDVFEQRLVFDIENANFGVPPVFPLGEPYADLVDFNPITYIQDPGTFMYPSNLWNLGELPNHEFDGLTEVFDKRTSILGQVDLRYEGKTTRGALVGAASERPWGSKEITDKWELTDNAERPFLDGPQLMSGSQGPGTPIMAGEMYLTGAFTAGGYQYTQASGDALELWGNMTNPPVDRTGNVTLTPNAGTFGFENNVIGSRTHSAWKYNPDNLFSPLSAEIDFGTDNHWDSRIGFAGAATTTAYPDAPGVNQFTMAVWVKMPAPESSAAVLFSMGQDNSGNNLPSLYLGLDRDFSTTGDSPPTGTSRRPHILINGGIGSGTGLSPTSEAKEDWVTQDWDQFPEGEWHHLAVTVIVVQGNQASNPPFSTTIVEMFVDGVKKNVVHARSIMTTNYGKDNIWKLQGPDPAGRLAQQCLFGTNMGSQYQFKGSAAEPAIWSRILGDDEIKAVYEMQRENQVVGYIHPDQSREIKPKSLQAFQDITQAQDDPFYQEDYHDKVYFSLISHNNSDMRNALRLLNSSSCNSLTDPFEKRASRGTGTSDKAGSIAFRDMYITGEYE